MTTFSWLRFLWGLWSIADFLLSMKGSILIFASTGLWAASSRLHEWWSAKGEAP